MRRGRTSRVFATALSVALLGIGVIATSASASFHEMKVTEVSAGTGSDDSYLEVQMYAPGQNFLSQGAKLAICNDICSVFPAEFSGFSDVPGGANQSTIVIGDSGLASGSKDFTRDLNIDSVAAGGAACYVSEPGFSDCVSWGTFSNNASLMSHYDASADSGSPAPALSSGMALRRSISPACPTALDASDDTNNSAADFAITTPNPRPNSVAPTEITCGPPVITGYPTQPVAPGTSKKKKKCKKRKRSSGAGPAPAYVAKKKCKKKRK